MQKPMLILGCGYLGKRVAQAWLEDGHEVFALTRSSPNADEFRQMGVQPLLGDVCDVTSLNSFPDAEIILHAIGFDRNSGRSHDEVTCGGVRNILQQIGQQCRRFIYVSSTSVYGQSNGEWVNEDSECCPGQLGGQLNLAAEYLVRNHFPAKDQATILRLAGIYGPQRLLSRVESLKAGNPLTGIGDSWLNLIHVDDALRAILASARQGASGGTYNVVDDQPIPRSTYFGFLAKLIGAPTPIFDSRQPSTRGSGRLNKRCSNEKLRQKLNWIPGYSSIETGLPAAIGAKSPSPSDDPH